MSDRVGVLFLQCQEQFGADAAVHLQIMRALDRDRFDVHVACNRGAGSAVADSLLRLQRVDDIALRVTRFPPSVRKATKATLGNDLTSAVQSPMELARLVQYMRRQRISIIHGSDRPRDALFNVMLARLAGAKSCIHVHVKWSRDYGFPATAAVDRADAIMSISRFVTESVAATGKPRGAIHTVHNCIDPALWDPALSGLPLRRELNIADDAQVLASVSRLFPDKGQRELLRAFVLVKERIPNVVLIIAGTDAEFIRDQEYSRELKQMASQLGVERDVRFTGQRADIPNIMAACDVFTMPSFEEPFGLVFLEAMAMQKPVVALNDGGTPEVVEHEKAGLLSAHGDVPTLASNIVTLLRDDQLRRRMGHYGRGRVLDYFNPHRMAREVATAYESILGATSRGVFS